MESCQEETCKKSITPEPDPNNTFEMSENGSESPVSIIMPDNIFNLDVEFTDDDEPKSFTVNADVHRELEEVTQVKPKFKGKLEKVKAMDNLDLISVAMDPVEDDSVDKQRDKIQKAKKSKESKCDHSTPMLAGGSQVAPRKALTVGEQTEDVVEELGGLLPIGRRGREGCKECVQAKMVMKIVAFLVLLAAVCGFTSWAIVKIRRIKN